jgi:phenylacetate-coenzyme A ligase PaaK-like adenylate-forming protein
MKLRAQVEILAGDQDATVIDRETGLQLVVSSEIASLLSNLRSETSVAANDVHADQLLLFFERLGLTGNATLAEARQQQARYILADAEYSELPRARATVERAYRETALHREHLAATPPLGDGWQLSELPLLTKQDLRRHFPRGLTVDSLELGAALRTGDLVTTSTSGSTGERLQIYSDTRVPRIPQTVLDLWGVTPRSPTRPLRTAVLTSPGCSAGVCTRRNASFEERLSFEHTLFLESAKDPFDLTPAQVETMVDDMARFAPDLWLVNPVYLSLFTRAAERLGLPLPSASAIVSTYQTLSVCQQRKFARAYQAPVFEVYSATELGGSQVGVTCSQGAMHARLDHIYLEILRDGRAIDAGELGQPVVTTHHPSMPLARYALTDLVRYSLTPCACAVGSAWPTLVVEGRERDALFRSDRMVTPRQVDQALCGQPVFLYQVVETRPGHFVTSVVLDDHEPLCRSELEARLADVLVPDDLELCYVARLPFEDTGKFRFVVPCPKARDAGSTQHV